MQHEHRCSHTRGEDESFREVKIKIPDRKIWPGDVNDVMHRKRARRIWGIWEKSVSWVLASEEDGWLSGLAEIRPVVCSGVLHVVGGRWKSQHRKIVYHSPHVEKPFNSKVIKVSNLNYEFISVFCVSGFLLSINELWTFYVSKVKLATIVEGDPKAPFSIATTPRCRGGRYSIPWIAPLYPWTVPYNAEC